MAQEEGIYTIKRVEKLPVGRGNSNILYVIKEKGFINFYRWLPNGIYETLPIGGNDGSETKITSGTDIIITGSGTIADPYVIKLNWRRSNI